MATSFSTTTSKQAITSNVRITRESHKRKRPTSPTILLSTHKLPSLAEPPRKRRRRQLTFGVNSIYEPPPLPPRPKNEYVHIDSIYSYSKPVWEFHRPSVCVSYRSLDHIVTNRSQPVQRRIQRIQRIQKPVQRPVPSMHSVNSMNRANRTVQSLQRARTPIQSVQSVDIDSDITPSLDQIDQRSTASEDEVSTTVSRQSRYSGHSGHSIHSANSNHNIGHNSHMLRNQLQSQLAKNLMARRRHSENERASSVRASMMDNSELSALPYYDRERLSRMKLAVLYIKCCIAVLRPNSPTFPKQNELYRWLDSKGHPPLSRIDIRAARKALKEDFNILMHSNSNKLTSRYHSLQQAALAMDKIYANAKDKCCEAEKTKNGSNLHGASDMGSTSSDCSVPRHGGHGMSTAMSPGFGRGMMR